MATYKWYHDKRNKKASSWPLKIAISHRQLTEYIYTGYSLTEEEWNADTEKVEKPFPNIGKTNANLYRQFSIASEIVEAMRPFWKKCTVTQLKAMIEAKINEESEKNLKGEFNAMPAYSIPELGHCQTCYYDYAAKVEEQFRKEKRNGSADTIKDSITLLKTYINKDHLLFSQLNRKMLSELERKFLLRGNKLNGLGIRLRAIRQVFNLAIQDESTDVTEDLYPFGKGKYKIRTEKTENKNIPSNAMQKLLNFPLTPETRIWYHQQYFKFYFDAWGANFCDIAFARVKQIQHGRFKYRRRKTSWSDHAKPFNIKLSEVGIEIAEYFSRCKKPDDLLFPILEDVIDCGDWDLIWKTYKQRMSNHGRRIKSIGKLAGIPVGQIYMFRHTFFQTALDTGSQKSEIQELAGHGSVSTTEIYLQGFSNEHLDNQADQARRKVYTNSSSTSLPKYEHPKPVSKAKILSEPICLLTNQNKMMTVEEYLLSILPKHIEDGKVKHIDIVTDLLQNTGCDDGKLAMEYTLAFLNY